MIGGNHNISWAASAIMRAPCLGGGSVIVVEDDECVGAGATLLDGTLLSEGQALLQVLSLYTRQSFTPFVVVILLDL